MLIYKAQKYTVAIDKREEGKLLSTANLDRPLATYNYNKYLLINDQILKTLYKKKKTIYLYVYYICNIYIIYIIYVCIYIIYIYFIYISYILYNIYIIYINNSC